MSAWSTSNTTKVYRKALEEHFFLLPSCAVVATTVAFSGKRHFFSWPFLGFHTYFKIPIASLTLEKSALPGPATLAALFMTISNRKLSALGDAGVPSGLVGLE